MYMIILVIVLIMVVSLVFLSKFRRAYKRRVINKLIKEYPVFGGCRVKLYNKKYTDGKTLGYFSEGKRVVVVCMHNPLEEIMDTYLHERRHSEQALSNNLELNSMYNNSTGYRNWLENFKKDSLSFDQYYYLEHEVDAREWASKTLKEYLANN